MKFRFWVIAAGLIVAVLSLGWRMVDLMILERGFLLNQGDARSLRTVSIAANRGMITDRNGEPLAISTPVASIWIDPQLFHPNENELAQLANAMDMKPWMINALEHRNQHREFVYLKRGVFPYVASAIKALAIPGLGVSHEFRRYYTEGEVTAQLLGFTNIDDHGQEGVELEYDQWLSGKPGMKRVLKDRYGSTVADIDLLRAAEPGHDLVLSIDRRIQYTAYRTLKAAVNKYHAQSGSIVVLNVKTGEILALVNQPSFNPNQRVKTDPGQFRNRALIDVFEPGSTMKAFSVANAIQNGNYTPTTIIDTRPGFYMVAGKRVQDLKNEGVLTVSGVLQKSSNVGVSKMTLSLPPDSLYNYLIKIGFGEQSGSGFPGESAGVLVKRDQWKPFTLATLSFGYGLSVTNLQLASAYSVLAADGVKRPITFLKVSEQPAGKQVIKTEVAQDIRTMLQSVLDAGGTATRARVPGYHVSGKTGTVRMIGPNGYDPHHHMSMFVGMAPASQPELVISVVVKDPQGQYYAGLVAAPIFAKVMGMALRTLDIPPDDLNADSENVTEKAAEIEYPPESSNAESDDL